MRLRAAVTLDGSEISPDALKAGYAFVLDAIESAAERACRAVDWDSVSLSRRRSLTGRTVTLVGKARILR